MLPCHLCFPYPLLGSTSASAPSSTCRLRASAVASTEQVLPKEAAKGDGDFDVVKLDAAELLVKHVYSCCKSSA
ncbi:hypothetical protein GUJ93_ZPchr0001g32301 [Zizania palustris]|uniref:Uncharacterized protein n=1 Tax=Zizania palustris TaxID=103762 RepID=A0A8J5VLK1_ZIZPA|nr:hypothetical protein GUJ93_ZPchr0001g32301 [Zizania palustris]